MTTVIHRGVPKMATEIPPSITTPDTLETRLGTLRLNDGFPDDASVEKVYDNLDFQRGVEAFLNNISPVSLVALRKAIAQFGPFNQTVNVTENLLNARSVVPAPNSETVYAFVWLDLSDGPVVVENPPETVGFVVDAWNRYVTDLGNAGPDKGKGGKYLFVPPNYSAQPPEGYFVCKTRTFGNAFVTRGFVPAGDPTATVSNIEKYMRAYPLARASAPPETRFVNISGAPFIAVAPLDFSYYEFLNELVQGEPSQSMDPETLGVLASIGIEKGKPFAPDARMKKILGEAAMVGSATARAIVYKTRMKEAYLYPHSAWLTAFVGGSYEFERDNVRLLDARTYYYFYGGFGASPGISMELVGRGSHYAFAFVDSKGRPLDGSKSYKLHLPPNIPAKDFWSVIVYDNQTRAMLQTDQEFPSVSNQKQTLAVNSDGSVDVYFGPDPPKDKTYNWIQTRAHKGFGITLRLYGPLEPWFDKTWKPGEVEAL